jgi:ribonuclease Z
MSNNDHEDPNTPTAPGSPDDEDGVGQADKEGVSRREVLQAGVAGIAGLGAAMTPAVAEARRKKKKQAAEACEPRNPYKPKKGYGISIPEYYRPTPSVSNRNFFPPGEILAEGEMRISFPGSTPWPPTLSQSGTCIMVELGNGTAIPRRLFFDLGNGSVKNILSMGVMAPYINDIFISHLHIDHYHDLSYLYPFRAWSGGWKSPMRIYGPSGARPDLGTKHMIAKMKEMMVWHLENFDHCPIGDGYEIEVTEFDWRDENGICYDKDGVKVRHWPRSHVKDGASAYRLDWEEAGLSMVWTGDGRPDEKTAKYAEGVDVFITEGQLDIMALQAIKFGAPTELLQYTVDTYHTPYYAAGYLMKQVNPRVGMITHCELNDALKVEAAAQIRAHWPGLFLWGAPDVAVVNVTKDAIWQRFAVRPESASMSPPDPRDVAAATGQPVPKKVTLPNPRLPREKQQQQFLRDMEIDPHLYYPDDADRELTQHWPKDGFTIDVQEMIDSIGGVKKRQ